MSVDVRGRLALAPMEGLADSLLRDALTRIGGYDFCVTEFIRVTDTRLPHRVFLRSSPELLNGSRTSSGTPVRVQLLGSDPEMLAVNAASLATLSPAAIDFNFGCPAPTVNRHRGGAVLLAEPELLERILRAVRAGVPREIPVTAKMRLGIDDTSRALECAHALVSGGADELIVHARTKADGYKPPARWEWLARIREALPEVPVIANGEVWTVSDYRALRRVSGCSDVMLGRGGVADPFLARRIIGEMQETPDSSDWERLRPLVAHYWDGVKEAIDHKHAAGRLKVWLKQMCRTYPEAQELFSRVRTHVDPVEIDRVLSEAGCRPHQSMGA